jgi:hypothetical protein
LNAFHSASQFYPIKIDGRELPYPQLVEQQMDFFLNIFQVANGFDGRMHKGNTVSIRKSRQGSVVRYEDMFVQKN